VSELARTPLHDRHVALGARMVPFAGYAMPVQYRSILEEHAAVRERAGLFDVSHMGQIHFRGAGARASLDLLLTRSVEKLRPGRVRYALLCNQQGGVVDDVTVYRSGQDEFFLCVNAANVEKDFAWCRRFAEGAEIEDASARTGLLALQGPASSQVLCDLADPAVAELRRFHFLETPVAGVPALVSRTGYTGSDGFELYLPAEGTGEVWDALLSKGEARGLQPAGLGARDTLRLEAALPLYGHELDDHTTPLEAGLDRFVRGGGGFLGCEALERQAASGPERRLVGFRVEGRGIAREGHAIYHDGREVGRVTSGAPSPTLGVAIGLGYVPRALAAPGSRLEIEVRGRALPAIVVETPFVRG